MIKLNPYLNFNGTAEEALNFYKQVLGGQIPVIMRYRDMPGTEKMPEDELDKLMHIALALPDGTMLMASDATKFMGWEVTQGNQFTSSVSVGSREEADRIFAGLGEGGKITSQMKKEFWGAYFGMLTDRFGIQWMVSFDENPGQGEVFDKARANS